MNRSCVSGKAMLVGNGAISAASTDYGRCLFKIANALGRYGHRLSGNREQN